VQIGVFGRPIAGERASGDHAAFVHVDDGVSFAVCDGLGHGAAARVSSSLAVRAFYKHLTEPSDHILDAVHGAVTGTRGTVMAAVHARGGAVEAAVAGNITVQLVAPREERRFGGLSCVLGARGPLRLRPPESLPLAAGDVIVAFTDGIGSRTSIKEDLAVLREHPIVIAQRMIERHGNDDDALVLVAKLG
jgi:hypothetical protein